LTQRDLEEAERRTDYEVGYFQGMILDRIGHPDVQPKLKSPEYPKSNAEIQERLATPPDRNVSFEEMSEILGITFDEMHKLFREGIESGRLVEGEHFYPVPKLAEH
jgi:hypothetical protein